jgi:hypothetical protein
MIIEPAATTAEQNISQSSSAVAARPPGFLFTCAKRHPAIPIRKLRLPPSSGGLYQREALAGYGQRATYWIKVKSGV